MPVQTTHLFNVDKRMNFGGIEFLSAYTVVGFCKPASNTLDLVKHLSKIVGLQPKAGNVALHNAEPAIQVRGD